MIKAMPRRAVTKSLIGGLYALCLTSCVTPGSSDLSQPTIIPFERVEGDTAVLVPVLLNGTQTVRLALDTGAGIEVIASGLAQNLHVTPTESYTGHRLNGEPLAVKMGAIESIAFGPIIRRKWLVAPLEYFDDLSKTANIQGLLSLNFFDQHPFTIDYPKGVIVLETPASLARRRETGNRLTLHREHQFSRSLDVEVDLLVDGKQRQRAIVDTGSASTKLPMSFFASMSLKRDDPSLKEKTFPAMSGTASSKVYLLPVPGRIQLADAASIINDGSSVVFEDNLRVASIGGNFFRNYAVTFNVQDNEIILSRR